MEEEIIEIEHTADIGFIIKAKTLEDLIKRCSQVLSHTLVYPENIEEKENKRIEIMIEDEEFLIIDVLRELLFLFETQNFIWKDADVRIKNKKIEIILKGEKFNPKKHKIKKDVKAITYHDYYLKKLDNFFETKFILDI